MNNNQQNHNEHTWLHQALENDSQQLPQIDVEKQVLIKIERARHEKRVLRKWSVVLKVLALSLLITSIWILQSTGGLHITIAPYHMLLGVVALVVICSGIYAAVFGKSA